MGKPILLTVDDDADVLRAIERDLRSHYGAQYRVLASDSPEGALDRRGRSARRATLRLWQQFRRRGPEVFLEEMWCKEALLALRSPRSRFLATIQLVNARVLLRFFEAEEDDYQK